MTSSIIEIPTVLRDRLAEFAERQQTTLAGAIALCIDRAEATHDAERLAGTLTDGLGPDEDWTDVL